MQMILRDISQGEVKEELLSRNQFILLREELMHTTVCLPLCIKNVLVTVIF